MLVVAAVAVVMVSLFISLSIDEDDLQCTISNDKNSRK